MKNPRAGWRGSHFYYYYFLINFSFSCAVFTIHINFHMTFLTTFLRKQARQRFFVGLFVCSFSFFLIPFPRWSNWGSVMGSEKEQKAGESGPSLSHWWPALASCHPRGVSCPTASPEPPLWLTNNEKPGAFVWVMWELRQELPLSWHSEQTSHISNRPDQWKYGGNK